MVERSRRRTVPQIFIEGQSIGGYDDLARINAIGELDRLLGASEQAQLGQVFDVVVVGAGPAGLSAAIYAARKDLSVAIEMSGIATRVILISIGDLTGDAILQDKVNASDVEVLRGFAPTEIQGTDQVEGLTVVDRADRSTRRLDVDGVFIEKRWHQPNEHQSHPHGDTH